MKYLKSIVLGAAIVLSAGIAKAADTPPLMALPGSMAVSQTGAATYSIPIAIAPGTSGMAPALTLGYSSQNGVGFEGVGWALSGLPAITRCPQTIAQDSGYHGAVNYDGNDRFCLDGQRLMVTTGGTYGANLSEYRTEIDTFSRVIAHTVAGVTGPAWFEVHTKSGQTIELGNTVDSRVMVVSAATGLPTSTVREWVANKITDLVGNYWTVTYNCSPSAGACTDTDRIANGEAYPLEIDYTGNATAGVAPYNSVRFTYASRADTFPVYQAGGVVQTTVRLTHIKAYQSSNVVYDYQIGYDPSSARSRITSVTECDGGSPSPQCLPATTFGWQGGASALSMSSVPNTIVGPYGYVILPGDWNGDGITDYAYADAANGVCPPYSVLLGPNYTSSSYQVTSGASAGVPGLCALHKNQTLMAPDGTANVILTQSAWFNTPPPGHPQYYASLVTTAGAINIGTYSAGGTAINPFGGDYNGDGIVDFLALSTTNTLYLGNNNGAYCPVGNDFCSAGTYSLSTGYLTPADYNGDGCTDAFTSPATGGASTVYYLLCNAPSPTAAGPTIRSNDRAISGDFNGDGKTDVLLVNPTLSAQLWLSTGTGFVNATSSLPSDWGKYEIDVGDWNGDGKADLLLVASGASGFYGAGTSHKVYLSTGTTFVAALDGSGNSITIANSQTSADAVVADWNNDGNSDFVIQDTAGETLYSFAYSPELMTSVSNGIGANTNIAYDRLNQNGALYQKCSNGTYSCGYAYPIQPVEGPVYVVSRVDASNGLGACPGNCYSTTYAYGEGQTDLTGRGFIGFATVSSTDLQTGIVQTTNYNMTFPYLGQITSQTAVHSSTILLSAANTFANNASCSSTYTAPGSGIFQVCITQNVTTTNDTGGQLMQTVTTDHQSYDNYGNRLTVWTTAVNGAASSLKKVTNTYYNDLSLWIIGRPTGTTADNLVGASHIVRTSSYTPSPTTGLITQEVIEPGVSPTCGTGAAPCTVTTDYGYDNFGHRISTTLSTAGLSSRTSYAEFDSLGQFETRSTNALGQSEFWTYSPSFGSPLTHTGPNGISTSWSYDTFGRLIQESRADGTMTKSSYALCSSGCPQYGAYSMQSEGFASDGVTQVGATQASYYDSLARSIASEVQGFNGNAVRTAIIYDANERVYQKSRPYSVTSDAPKFTTYAYDYTGRVTQETFPDSSQTTYGYNGWITTVTNNLSQTTTRTRDIQGLTASVQDAASKTTTYTYDAFGELLTATDSVTPTANVVTNAYDVRGNKISSVDPDMGTWTYNYDGFGELIGQTDAKSQSTSLTYDDLGRVLTRTETGLYSSWSYGTSPGAHNIGKIVEAKTCPTSACATTSSDRKFYFDGIGRPAANTLTTGGSDYGYNQNYNSTNGKLSNLQYPSGFSANYTYNSLGYLTFVADDKGSPILSVNARDAEFHLTSSTQGNGVLTTQAFDPNTGLIQSQVSGISSAGLPGAVANFAYSFDTIGNLTNRTDKNEIVGGVQPLVEIFCYDSLNRLTTTNIGTTGVTCPGGKTVGYDNIGNITSKSGVGTYSYPSSGTSRPHAVSSIAGTVDGLTNPQYSYDGNGNLTCVSTGTACTGTVGRQITVTSFNMAASLSQGSTAIALTYDESHQRLTQATTVGGTTTTITYLSDPATGAMSQKVQVGSAVPQWVDYIQAEGLIIAQRSVTYQTGSLWGSAIWNSFNWGPPNTGSKWNFFNWGSGTWNGPLVTWAYFSLDHLGSVAVISDQGGNVVQRLSFDPWGKQRNADGTDVSCGTITSSSTRGFTNQEEMPAQCLVNLNARIYDATLGRFTAPDPYVPNTYDGQSFNRFSYVSNNPASFTDRTGRTVDWSDRFTWDVSYGCAVGCETLAGNINILRGLNPTAEVAFMFGRVGGGGGLVSYDFSTTGINPSAATGFGNASASGIEGQYFDYDTWGNVVNEIAYVNSLPSVWISGINGFLSTSADTTAGTSWSQSLLSFLPHGGGIMIGGNATAGLGNIGAAVNGTAGGLYLNLNPFESSGNGLFTGGGVAANAGNLSAGKPAQSTSNKVLGASASGGFSGFLTNATSVDQLAGPFTTQSIDIGLGPFQVGGQLSTGNGIWQFSISPPFAGGTFGISYSEIITQTCTSKGCN